MMSDIVVRRSDYLLSIVARAAHECLDELARCIICITFGKYLIVIDAL